MNKIQTPSFITAPVTTVPDSDLTNPKTGTEKDSSQNTTSFWTKRRIAVFTGKCLVGALGVALLVSSIACPAIAGLAFIAFGVKIALSSYHILPIVGGLSFALTYLPIVDTVRKIYGKIKKEDENLDYYLDPVKGPKRLADLQDMCSFSVLGTLRRKYKEYQKYQKSLKSE